MRVAVLHRFYCIFYLLSVIQSRDNHCVYPPPPPSFSVRHFICCLVLFQQRNTRPDMTCKTVDLDVKTRTQCTDICTYNVEHRREKICLQGFANNKGADQHAHLRRLIGAFTIRFLESILPQIATGDISIFQAYLCR